MAQPPKSGNRVPAIGKSWRIINFVATKPDASISEIATGVSLSKSTVSDLVRALCDEDVLLRRTDEPKFRLGPELIAVGAAAQRQLPERRLVREILKRLARDWTCNVIIAQFVEHSMSFVIVDSISAPIPGAFSATVGAQLSFTSRAVGRAYLAGIDRSMSDELLRKWYKLTATAKSPEDFIKSVEAARRLGYVIIRGEYSGEILGEINAVSVPVATRKATAGYVMALIGYPRDLPSEKLDAAAVALVESASELSEIFL